MSLSSHAAPALSDDDGAPVRELSHRGGRSGAAAIIVEIMTAFTISVS
jgi:hypothetical protein